MSTESKLRKINYTAEPSSDGFTVESLLLEKGYSRRLITRLKHRNGGLLLNGEHTRTVDILHSGDVLSVVMEDEKYLEENGELNIPIVYEDDDVVIFDKPSQTPVHPSIRHYNDTLGNYFAYLYKELSFRPINRLDRDTSGLCAVAKNAYAASSLGGKIEKTYYAVVGGIIFGAGEINALIARESDTIIKRCVADGGQSAITRYEAVAHGDNCTLVKVNLLTGRTHQIRVHFAHIGHALLGDELYGGDCSKISRQALHCGEAEFVSPVSRERICVKSELPDDMRALLP